MAASAEVSTIDISPGDLDLLAIGETLVDLISLEEADSLRDAYTFRKYLGGSPANIAVYVAKLGGRAAIVSKTGIGAFGQFLKAELRAAGVITDYLVMDHRVHTSVIFVSRTKRTPDFEAFRGGDYQLEPREVEERAVERARVVHASTFALSREPCRSAVARAFELAHQHGKIISLDPNYSQVIWPNYSEARTVIRRLLGYATLTKPSLDDAARLFGPGRSPEEYIGLFHEMGPRIVVLTMGAQGTLLSEEGRISHIPARPIAIADATGAGDSFWAGFLVALLDGHSLRRCALFAREVAERKLTTVGPLPEIIERQTIYAQVDATEDGTAD
ncbi:MAG TPA: carbohydrate kinase [Ardenticatenaceae bacterium]|nr:carbohydrate kinase [Ardenticatenaceae bacterium]